MFLSCPFIFSKFPSANGIIFVLKNTESSLFLNLVRCDSTILDICTYALHTPQTVSLSPELELDLKSLVWVQTPAPPLTSCVNFRMSFGISGTQPGP